MPLSPPLPLHLLQALPPCLGQGPRVRPSPQFLHPRALPQPPATLLLPPITSYAPAPIAAYLPPPVTTCTPVPTMTCALALSIAAMPLIRSKLAPCFMGNIEYLIEDFLEEYKRLADRYGLTGPQKVETVIWYVDRSQCHIWQHLPGFLNRNWDTFHNKLHKEYISPTPKG